MDEVARAAAHCFDGQFDIGPGGHHDDRQRGVERLNAGEQIQTLLARGRVPGVIQVHQHDVELALVQRGQDFGGRILRFGPVTFSFQQKTQRLGFCPKALRLFLAEPLDSP